MNQPSITCPRCHRTSYSQGDIANGYCGWCKWPTSDRFLGQPEAIAMAERDGAITPIPSRVDRTTRKLEQLDQIIIVIAAASLLVLILNFWLGNYDSAFMLAAITVALLGVRRIGRLSRRVIDTQAETIEMLHAELRRRCQ